ncbi:hypothetical protein DOM21_14860 [Bacteriovorax stolpii]|uniref:hypothetical protein n=1 Tax=Bacteriovorax stolpii TaxID=960 RepID=UPI00115B430F|nr:hypothetical protein [Bacteriovorax stolpii]QDK42707.1 hypothetical protein DOM21_14860 [Bacteriovorax stolpii]
MREKEEISMKEGEGKREKRKYKRRETKKSADEIQKDQCKFIIDVTKNENGRELIRKSLVEGNKNKIGREINLTDLVLASLPLLTQKHYDAIWDNSLTDDEKMERECFEYNQKNGTNYKVAYYFVNVRKVLKEAK